MKQLVCDTCTENAPPMTRPAAAFHDPAEQMPWKVVACDVKDFPDELFNERTKFNGMIDEGTRYVQADDLFTTPMDEARNA